MAAQIKDFIDIHSHILPGLDDGAKDMAESLDMARCYERTGVKRVVATPHFLPGTAWATEKKIVKQSVLKLQASLDRHNIDLQVFPGMEIAFHRRLEERMRTDSFLPLAESNYYLIEPSFHGEQDFFLESLKSLLKMGRKIILAHPERIDLLHNQLDVLESLVKQGLLIQVNAGSLLGHFGPGSLNAVNRLHQKHCLHFIASDAHGLSERAPITAEEWRKISEIQGGEILSICNNNIKKIFSND
jgi:protein-tyrosine phosphatase